MALSTEDRLDILELPGRYAEALDTLAPEQLGEVFTDDAVWEVEGGRVRLVGLDEIKEFMGQDIHPGAHLMTNLFIAESGEDPASGERTAVLRSRGIYPVDPSDPKNPTGVFYGRYDDQVVRTDVGWRIRHRVYRYGT